MTAKRSRETATIDGDRTPKKKRDQANTRSGKAGSLFCCYRKTTRNQPEAGDAMKFNDIKNSIAGRKPKEETGKGLKPGSKGPEEKQEDKKKRPEAVLTPEIQKILDSAPVDDKGRKIVPDDVFDEYYKNLPQGTRNESLTKLASYGGYMNTLGANPSRDREIQKMGGEALQANLKQRRSLSEDIQIALMKKATPEAIKELGLPTGATNQEAITVAVILQAISGNVKAQQYIRDTIGEQPTARQDIAVTMSDDDRRLLEQVEKRLEE